MKDLSEQDTMAFRDMSSGPEFPNFMRQGLSKQSKLRREIEELQDTLADIEAIGGDEVARKTRRMAAELDAFAPAITFIGQVKSGKTTLVNALAGRPGLLPADVNPWTSVVTSLHMGHPRPEGSPAASFTFFDAGEWDHLVENGGRIGELSERTGADKEAERLRVQIAEMREKTKARLGRKFEMLLGQTHTYQTLADDLIQRYVCLGDDFETASAKDRQGQFADITRSAELYLDAPHLPYAMTLRDTPGLNDTFMMREQITIKSIRDSRICCVVLSAHQALNAVDMGIIRMISNVKSRQIVIYVNRIDELAAPHRDIPEIRDSLTKTLSDATDGDVPQILFGSAAWAEAALRDMVADLPEASIAALEDFGSFSEIEGLEEMQERDAVWALSGLPALMTAFGERIDESAGAKTLSGMRKRAANIVSGLRASSSIVTLRANSDQIQNLTIEEVGAVMNVIEERSTKRMQHALDEVFTSFEARVDQAQSRYVSRALDALLRHFERNGDGEVWSYNADGLRMLMRSGYQVMGAKFKKQVQTVLDKTSEDMTIAYSKMFDVTQEHFEVQPPGLPELPQPVTLAQMIVLDAKTSWWKSWWGQRKGWRQFADGFRELIEAETETMVHDLKVKQVAEIRALAHQTLNDFIEEQRSVLADIYSKSQVGIEDLHGLFGVTSQEEREELFNIIYEELDLDTEDMGEAA